MANAQLRYQGLADAKRTLALDFKVGDQVYVKAKYFQSTRPSKKLSEKNLGPHNIIVQVGSLSFMLCLPDSMRAVHPVFHVSQLEKSCKLLYLVHWSGYEGTDKETSWLLTTELGNAMELLEDYHVCYLDKPGPLASM